MSTYLEEEQEELTPTRAQRRAAEARSRKSPLVRAVRRAEPTARGWSGAGGGRANWLESPAEWLSTSSQVCGLWPWAVGQGPPPIGVPLGRHLETGQWVCADPISWFVAGLINAPTCFVLGRMGLGKSRLIRHLITCMRNYGVIPLVMSDTRPDYVDDVRALGGQVISLGPGQSHVNPLDPGPLADYIAELVERGDEQKVRECLARIRSQRLNAIAGLLEIVLEARIGARESNVLAKAIDIFDDEGEDIPVIGDLLRLIESRDPRLRVIVGDRGVVDDAGVLHYDDNKYDDRVEDLVTGLATLDVGGIFGDTFGCPTDERIRLGVPFVFDISSVDEDDTMRMAAVQYLTWSQATQALIAATYLTQAEILAPSKYVMVGDELYRALRALPLVVRRVDSIIRMIRRLDSGLILCTHTMADLNLDGVDGPLTKIAWGFVERSDMVFMGGLSVLEMGNLQTVWAMSETEKRDVTGWSDLGAIDPDSEEVATPQGQGKFLLKLGRSPGIPFSSVISDAEKEVGDTNARWQGHRDRLFGHDEDEQ